LLHPHCCHAWLTSSVNHLLVLASRSRSNYSHLAALFLRSRRSFSINLLLAPASPFFLLLAAFPNGTLFGEFILSLLVISQSVTIATIVGNEAWRDLNFDAFSHNKLLGLCRGEVDLTNGLVLVEEEPSW